MNKNEIYSYLFIAILTFILVNFSVLTYRSPNFTDPFNFEPPEFEPPDINADPNPSDPPNFQFFRIIIYLLIFIAIAIGLYFLAKGVLYLNLGWQKRRKGIGKSIKSQKRIELEDARKRAYEIIEEGLTSGNYSSAYIEAYLALDTGLENYRNLKRPKYITPKEYSFSVNLPVFQPSVFKIVSVYYDLRYGSSNATREQLIDFRLELDYLFVDEVPEDIKASWTEDFDQKLKKDYVFKIPRKGDQTKPGGNW